MTAADLLAQLNALDVQLSIDGETLRANAPSGVLDETLVREITMHKSELVRIVRDRSDSLIKCPWCGCSEWLYDCENGIKCEQCQRLAWFDADGSIIRADSSHFVEWNAPEHIRYELGEKDQKL